MNDMHAYVAWRQRAGRGRARALIAIHNLRAPSPSSLLMALRMPSNRRVTSVGGKAGTEDRTPRLSRPTGRPSGGPCRADAWRPCFVSACDDAGRRAVGRCLACLDGGDGGRRSTTELARLWLTRVRGEG